VTKVAKILFYFNIAVTYSPEMWPKMGKIWPNSSRQKNPGLTSYTALTAKIGLKIRSKNLSLKKVKFCSAIRPSKIIFLKKVKFGLAIRPSNYFFCHFFLSLLFCWNLCPFFFLIFSHIYSCNFAKKILKTFHNSSIKIFC